MPVGAVVRWLSAAFVAAGAAFVTAPAAAQVLCDDVATTADVRLAAHCAGVRADRSMQALSRRYAEIWAQLAPEQKRAFSATERRWLSTGRYRERDACVAQHGAPSSAWDAELLAAECLAEVTARRLREVNRFAESRRALAAR